MEQIELNQIHVVRLFFKKTCQIIFLPLLQTFFDCWEDCDWLLVVSTKLNKPIKLSVLRENFRLHKFSPIRKFFESSLDLGYILPLLQLLLGILNLNYILPNVVLLQLLFLNVVLLQLLFPNVVLLKLTLLN